MPTHEEKDELQNRLSHYETILKYPDHYKSRYNIENVKTIVTELKSQLKTLDDSKTRRP